MYLRPNFRVAWKRPPFPFGLLFPSPWVVAFHRPPGADGFEEAMRHEDSGSLRIRQKAPRESRAQEAGLGIGGMQMSLGYFGAAIDEIRATLRQDVREVVREELKVRPQAEDSFSPAPPKGLLGTCEVAKRLDVTEPTVRRWIRSGRLRATRPGQHWRVRQEDLDSFVAKQRADPEASPNQDENIARIMGRIGRFVK